MSDEDESHIKAPIFIDCDIYQAARLNMLLPKHLKIEADLQVIKAMNTRKQTLANRKKQEERNRKKEHKIE